jgi:glycosyltransferase involved in cell wall biosynthesis
MSSASRGPGTLHVIEPTLEDYAGHCYGLVRSLCEAAKDLPRVTLWAGTHAAQLEFPANIDVHPHFHRRLRVPQLWLLLRRLLGSHDDPIVLTTAKRVDLTLARLAARGTLPPGRLYLYFHWFRESPKRLAFLRKAAAAQPNLGILATTESVAAIFKTAGFAQVVYLPYPLTAAPGAEAGESPFRHLLYAGAARQDKGFGHIVELAELLRALGKELPLTVQVSAEHYGKYDETTRAQLRRLENVNYAPLRLIREPLTPADYAELFRGAVCLQPYDRTEFKDRASGVTMDALTQGAPIVATSGSWIAQQIRPHEAGVTLDDPRAADLLAAAEMVIASYGRYRRNALAAAQTLRARSWEPLLSRLRARNS